MRGVKILSIVFVAVMMLILGIEYLGIASQGVEPKIDVRSLAETRPLHAAASTPAAFPPTWVDSLMYRDPDTNGVAIDTCYLDSSIIYEAWPAAGGIFVSTKDSMRLILRGGTIIKSVKHFKNLDTLVMNTAGTHFWDHNGLGGCTQYDYLLEPTGYTSHDSLGDTTFVYGVTVRDRH